MKQIATNALELMPIIHIALNIKKLGNINSGILQMVGAQAMLAIMAACVRALKTLPLIEIVLLRSLAGVILVGSYMLIFNISFRGRQKLDLVWCVFSYTA
jgi:hypothetical protein